MERPEWIEREAKREASERQMESPCQACVTDREIAQREAVRSAIRRERDQLQDQMADLCVDKAHLKDILGIHARWSGSRASSVRVIVRQMLSEVEAELKPIFDQTQQLRQQEIDTFQEKK